jgi:hypothetical protein
MRTVGEHAADGNLARHNSRASNTPLYDSFGTDERIQRMRQRSYCDNQRARAAVQPLSQRQSAQPLYTYIRRYSASASPRSPYIHTYIHIDTQKRREIIDRYRIDR